MIFDIKKVKIFVTVPENNLESVRTAVCEAGAGIIGNYNYCTFSCGGKGTFIPNDNANPHIGTANKLEIVSETKIEFVCEIEKVKEVVRALRNAHPYEEPAIDIIPLIDENEF